jgi:circadian clock protein KaiC
VRRALSVIKKRSGAHEDTIREMFITSQGVQVGRHSPAFTVFITRSKLHEY